MMPEVSPQGFYAVQLQQHLRTVLEATVRGCDTDPYRGLLNDFVQMKFRAFGQKDEQAEYELSNLLAILTACISSLQQKQHAELVSEIYMIPLWQCTQLQELRQGVLSFLLNLAVLNGTTIQPTLLTVISALQMPFVMARDLGDEDDSGNEWTPSELVKAVHEDIAIAVDQMIFTVPVSLSLLPPIIGRAFPNKLSSKALQCTFLHGLLRLAELKAAGPVRDSILVAVVQHLLSLDVEILWQDISWSPAVGGIGLTAFPSDDKEEEEVEGEQGGQSDHEGDIFEIEGTTGEVELDPDKFRCSHPEPAQLEAGEIADERISGRGGFEGQAQDLQPSTSGRTQVDANADKLDCMMCLVFQHLERRVAASDFKQAPDATKEFVDRLLHLLANPQQADINRSAAAAYLASFLSRAAFITPGVLAEAIQKLAVWCLDYSRRSVHIQHVANGEMTGQQGVAANPIPQSIVHQVFYAACQGLLYVLCYRMEQLMESADGNDSHSAVTLRQIFKDIMPPLLHNRLAPLKVCLPTVVSEFSRLSLRLCLLDSNSLPPAPGSLRCQRPLEMFFPFDPYLLRHSSRFLDLKSTFVRWKGGHIDATDRADADDSGTEEEEENMDVNSSSGSESSGLSSAEHDSDSDDGESQLVEEFQDLTPKDGRVEPENLGIQIRRKRQAAQLAASYSTAGTSSPSAPMSWTPPVPAALARHHHTLLRPLDD